MTAPAHALARLGEADRAALEGLLADSPILNVYLRSELRISGVGGGLWWGVQSGGRLRATLLGGPLVVPWVPVADDAPALSEALTRQPAPRMLVGPRDQVMAVHRAREREHPPREIRDPQHVLRLERGRLRVPPAPQVVRSTVAHLNRLTVAAAAMHREEMGVDPIAIDPSAWRARMGQLIDRGWSWIWTDAIGDVVFKTELSAWTPEVVQIQGVWTAPRHRRCGVGAAGLAAVCEAVLRDVPSCVLYVNGYNRAGLALYRRLGFERVADYATVMY